MYVNNNQHTVKISTFLFKTMWSIMKWRKKIARCTSFNTDTLVCNCRGPASLSQEELEQRPQILLSKEELQTLIDKDIDNKTMQQWADCMQVSKTVYAWIYASARQKVTQSLVSWSIIMIECNKK